MDKFWMVYVWGAAGSKEWRYASETEAKDEAERLARQHENFGRKVVILEATQYCEVPARSVTWATTNG